LLHDLIERNSQKPVYLVIRERVLAALESGVLVKGMQLPPEPEWAENLGVSRMTLNKAILSLVQDGWLERAKGRGTFVAERAGLQNLQIGIVIAEDLQGAINNYYFGSLFFGIVSESAAQNFSVELIQLDLLLRSPASYVRFDGLIVINPPIDSLDSLKEVRRIHPQIVILGSTWPGSGFTCVDSDNIHATALGMQHLIVLGHERISFIGACPQDANSQDRLRGFDIACSLAGLNGSDVAPWSPSAVEICLEAETYLRNRLTSADRPTAIFAGGAMIALQVMRICSEMGLQVPGDLSIVTFDDPPFLSTSSIGISTLVQPLSMMVKDATSEILRLCKDPIAKPSVTIRHAELTVRGSTAAPRPFRTETK
jgi:DNA-binding LacI/PurR family transcriptional regulator